MAVNKKSSKKKSTKAPAKKAGPKISIISLGCAKNRINSEQMLSLLLEAGFTIVADPAAADVAIVNTCGFIESAKSEAIDIIIELGQMKADKSTKLKKLIVAGCLSQRYQKELLTELPEIDALVGVGSFTDIVPVVVQVLNAQTICAFGDINAAIPETGRVVTTGKASAYIQIAEGCDNHCAYCVIPQIRGRYRSRPMENILEEARNLVKGGIRELIVVAQDVTRYGTDFGGASQLPELLEALCTIEDLRWIRLLYLYPNEIDDRLIDVIAREPKVLKYLDIPIQHISDRILADMNRRGDGAMIRALFKKLRERIPGVVLRTSLISGLPGEGEAEFEELCEFLREAKIERAGVFTFSPEEGTDAAEMAYPESEIAAHRAELIEDLQSDVMDAFNASRIGSIVDVLCTGYDPVTESWYGRSYAEGPDVDGLIHFTGDDDVAIDRFYAVRLTEDLGGDMLGELI